MTHTAGSFAAKVITHGFTTTMKGADQLAIEFETSEGKVTAYLALTDKAAQYSIDKIRAIGFCGDDMGQLADGTAMAGMQCTIEIQHETYNGKVLARVGWIYPAGETGHGNGIKRDAGAALKAQAFNALLAKAKKIGPVPAPF